MFIEGQAESVFKLTGFTKNKIILAFPGTYAKTDKVTRKLQIIESLASINVIDDAGNLFIFDLEKDLKTPDSKIKIFKEEKIKIVKAEFDFKLSVAHIIYLLDHSLYYLGYE